MRRLVLTFLAFSTLSLGVAPGASAADIPVRIPAKAASYVPTYNWTGAYLGVSLGGRWATNDSTAISIGGAAPLAATASNSTKTSTFRAGGYLGYNWQVARLWVVGIEGDIAWGNGNKTNAGALGVPFNGADSNQTNDLWDSSLRGRAGFLLAPTWLFYGTGGVAWQSMQATANCSVATCGALGGIQQNSTTRTGWTVGGGIEATVWGNWLARAEYRYADYGTWRSTYFTGAAASVIDARIKTNTALVGLAYRF